MHIPIAALKRWFPEGVKSKMQAVPVGLLEECLADGGTALSTLPPSAEHELGHMAQAIAQLSDRVKQLESEFGLHDNNGKHWTQQQIQDLAGGKSASLVKDEKAIGDLIQAVGALANRIKALEGAPAPDPGVPSPDPTATPKLSTAGKDDLMKLELSALLDFAKKHGIDISGLPQDDKGLLADYIAASMNLPK